MRDTHTLTSAATQLKTRASTVAYWLPRLLAAGVIEERGEIKRAGKAMPRYRSVARSFVMSYKQVPIEARIRLFDGGRVDMMNRMLDGLDEELARRPEMRFSVFAPDTATMAITSIDDESTSPKPFTDSWMSLRLDEADAVEFASRLDALCEEFA
ncbi:MAG TPA: hypothetical protein PLV68_04255, partial [Ilumatobacteraceae bacterium]|nr:hypothetical protein [Ilumatobacteraceae bacterium]